jgi:hypothetical protein
MVRLLTHSLQVVPANAGNKPPEFVIPGCALAQARNPYSPWQRLSVELHHRGYGFRARASRAPE